MNSLVEQMPQYELSGPKQAYFSPYSFNGGTSLAISGEDFSVIASDTRLSEGFSIHSRDCPKIYKLTKDTLLACCGFHGDVLTLTKMVDARIKMYRHEHNSEPSTNAIAAMLSTTLYYRRFFPYYTYNIVAGLDEGGKGAVYSYDPIGSYERETYRAAGSASAILQPLLDNQIGFKNQQNVVKQPLTKEKAVALAKDVFISASERDIYTGDAVEIQVITKEGVAVERLPLRKD